MSNAITSHADVIDAPDLHIATGSGRVAFDERGNGIWEWQTQPGVFSREISSEQLRKLQDLPLQLVDAHPRRNFEGLWIHDTDRTVADKQFRWQTQATQTLLSAAVEKRGAFEAFLKRLGLAD